LLLMKWGDVSRSCLSTGIVRHTNLIVGSECASPHLTPSSLMPCGVSTSSGKMCRGRIGCMLKMVSSVMGLCAVSRYLTGHDITQAPASLRGPHDRAQPQWARFIIHQPPRRLQDVIAPLLELGSHLAVQVPDRPSIHCSIVKEARPHRPLRPHAAIGPCIARRSHEGPDLHHTDSSTTCDEAMTGQGTVCMSAHPPWLPSSSP
jgi:hypothetical protein